MRTDGSASATGAGSLTENGERLAWLTVIAVAVALRFYSLGASPLDLSEANLAMESYRETGAGRGWAAVETAHPALTNGMSTLFYLFGASEASARLISALAGVGTVAAMWWSRAWLGSLGALGAAALLAISPTHIDVSRTVAPGALAGLCLTIVVIMAALALSGFGRRTSQLAVGGAALAVGLGTDATFTLHGLALLAALIFAFDFAVIREHLQALKQWAWRPLIVAFALTAAVVDTRLATNLGGVQAGLIDNLWTWATEILAPGRLPLLPVVHLIGTEPLLIVMAIVGAIGVARADGFSRFSAAWLLLAFGLLVVWGRVDGRMLAPLTIAGALVGGPALARLVSRSFWREPAPYIVAAAAAVPLVAAFIASLPQLRNSAPPPTPVLIAGIAGLAGALIGAYALSGWRTARRGVAVLGTALLGVATVGGMSRLAEADTSQIGRLSPGTLFTSELRRLETQLFIWEWDQDQRRTIVDERLQPVLAWTLRGNRSVQYAPPEDVQAGPAVKLATARAEAIPDKGQRITVGYRAATPIELEPVRVAEWLLWRRPIPRLEPYDILVFR